MPFQIILLAILPFTSAPAFAQSANPECAYQSSDPDGDGYGFENNTTCEVTANSSPVGGASSNECIDDNADGWGWNGTSSCQVPIVPTDCVDTDPVGDGWGWDGSTSCRVVPAPDTFNEIEEVESHLGNQPSLINNNFFTRAAAIRCEPTAFIPERTFYLFYDGSVRTAGGASGAWGTGISQTDGSIYTYLDGTRSSESSGATVLHIDGDQVLRGLRAQQNLCEWIEPQ